MDQFDDIRPYNDSEVTTVLERLLADREFISSIGSLRLPHLNRLVPWLVAPVVKRALRRELKGVDSVLGFQQVVKKYMDAMIEGTSQGFTVSGLDRLSADSAYLFISNHRDITLDPAFVNYSLYRNGFDTVRIAIGDNLLSKPFAADLMRINKSFIVNRSAKGRAMLGAYKQLSAYIRHSISDDRCPIWIAQREGRAKDGNDRTEPAIIKMLAMSQQRKTESFGDFIASLNIVPVAISYEFDPCDGAKAKELYEKAELGGYEKAEHEDLASIGLGIAGDKGRVHVSYGQPLGSEFETPEAVAEEVDRQVIANYVLHPTNFIAYHRVYGEYPKLPCGDSGAEFSIEHYRDEEALFNARIEALPSAHRSYALRIYANPIVSRLAQSAE